MRKKNRFYQECDKRNLMPNKLLVKRKKDWYEKLYFFKDAKDPYTFSSGEEYVNCFFKHLIKNGYLIGRSQL